MAVKNFSPHATGSGYVRFNNANWNTCRGASNGNYEAAGIYVTCSHTGTEYFINRSFLSFNTSTLTAGAKITAATITATWTLDKNEDNDGKDFGSIVLSTQADPTDMAIADFDQAGSTEGSNRIDITGISGSQVFTLTETGRGWISKTGYSTFALREGHDLLNEAIANSTSNQALLTNIVLSVTYTLPAGFFAIL